jgi:two-component system LytT family response regulator
VRAEHGAGAGNAGGSGESSMTQQSSPRPALIVDDERLARRDLRDLLESQHGGVVRIAGEAATVQEAATLARTSGADLVFLDIHLAGESGFDLLPLLEPDVDVVFVTAFDQHAVRAFEVNALDYLTKPVSPDRLAVTIARLRAGAGSTSDSAGPLAYDDRLFLRIDDRMAFLAVRDVVAIVADGDNASLWLANGRVVRVRKSLHSWEDRLPPKQFVRIHRSALVNLTAVERVEEWSHFTYRIYVRGYREPLEMSRRYGARVREQLG